MFPTSIVFSDIGASDLLWFAHQSFLANPVHPIYYFLLLRHFFSEIGPSDLLCFRPPVWAMAGNRMGLGFGVGCVNV